MPQSHKWSAERYQLHIARMTSCKPSLLKGVFKGFFEGFFVIIQSSALKVNGPRGDKYIDGGQRARRFDAGETRLSIPIYSIYYLNIVFVMSSYKYLTYLTLTKGTCLPA